MSYAGGNRGGTVAIVAAEALRAEQRTAHQRTLSVEAVLRAFPEAIDRVMGEAGFWDEETAAAAFLQAAGDTAEAVHLLRAHRSTLTRFAFSEPIEPDTIVLDRRICSAHRSPDGPQLLGSTVDYSPRLLRRPDEHDPLPPNDELLAAMASAEVQTSADHPDRTPQRYTRYLAENNLLSPHSESGVDASGLEDPEPFDLALEPVRLPASRSALLSAMAIAETGALVGMWYRSITGPDGYTDEAVTLGEVRHGEVDLAVRHPHTGDAVTIGQIRMTECEAIDHLNDRGEDPGKFTAGYGLALGHNERKAISMAALDSAAHRIRGTGLGDEMEQSIMLTLDGLAANGFLEHLKMPHYVTFRSMMERAEAAQAAGAHAERTQDDTREDSAE